MTSPIKNLVLKKYPEGNVTQWFAENPALYSRIGLAFHNGIDIVAPHGEPMYAVESGVVVDVNYDPKGHGKHVRFIGDSVDKDGCRNLYTYAHCSTIRTVVGARVKEGEHIADMGNTGFVVSGATPYWKVNPYAGTHLHFGIRKVKVGAGGFSYPKSDVKMIVQNYSNGVKGSIDPVPFLQGNEEAVTVRSLQLTSIGLLRTLISLLQKQNAKKNNAV